jgi:outer membrane protein TolC
MLRAAALLLFLSSNAAHAQTALTLDEALTYARAHQPRLKAALAELAARKQEARVPRAQWLPNIGGTAQLFYGTANNTTASYLSVPEVDLPRIGASHSQTSTHWSPAGSTLAALSVNQEVFDFGRIAAQAAIADAQVDVARAAAEDTALAIGLSVEETYHSVLAAKEVEHATDEAYRRATVHRDFAQAGVRTGMRPPIELTRAQADVAQLEVRRIQAVAGVRSARAALAAAIGSDQLEVDAAPAAEASLAPSFDEALHLAATKNPAIAAALARLRASEASSKEILREMAPNLFASATLSGRAGGIAPSSGGVPYGAGWLPVVGNWDLGLVLQWNIFDATVLARRNASLARQDEARAQLELSRMLVAVDAERAYLDLDAAEKALPGLDAEVTAARENQAQADARFRAGLGTNVELADAEALLTNAELERAVGRFNVARARAQLGRAIGERRLPGAVK